MLDLERIRAELAIPTPAPLYEQLRLALNNQIADGTLKAGEALPSERTIQETIEVSRSTIRQAIHSLVEQGHIQTVPGKGNFVLGWAMDSEPPNRSRVVGVIADSAALFLYYAQLASAFNHRMRNAGYYIDLALHNHDPAMFDEIIESFIQARAVAVAISPPTSFDINPVLQRLKDCGIHIVIIGRRSKSADTDYVDNDNRLLGYQATQHLLELGHTQIVHIGTPNYPTAEDRALGYVQAMQEANLPPRIFPRMVEPYMQSAQIPEDLAEYIAQGAEPSQVWTEIVRQDITAAVCFNDETAIWLQKGLRSLNLEIPRDISVVGVDNLPFVFDAPLTTFELPGKQIGEQAADLLLRRLGGEEFPPFHLKIPPKFIQRISTAPPKKRTDRQNNTRLK